MNTEKLKQLPELLTLLVLLAFAVGFFGTTSPRNVPALFLIVAFGLIYMTLYMALRLLTRLLRLKERLSGTQYRALVVGGAALPTVLLALQSIGQLTTRDVITIVALFAAAGFYVMRLAPKV